MQSQNRATNGGAQVTLNRNDVIKVITANKNDLAIRYSISRIGVFGSVARNQANENSDVDIVVEMSPDLFMRSALRLELENLLHSKVDVVRYSKRMNPFLKQRIDREAVYV